ncbi:ring-cleaving dioxygenase [Bacillus sp. AFS041924]|uniref:ring-cleaving dioxygenase n=1 Tax=Bacillus sp. AFS041924 TaxID=2033503 RepID=UPI000BFC8F67|nr:ring-cleaving dioxygenase [Bacillus sp. AFS041924]PGS52017.1 ring-cleaving dioxygenase [Bacillus sp. AFS041924]
MEKMKGIHHITAIVGDPQENMDFYAGILGLRFVKKTINFDDPGTYHFYFGNEAAKPGTIMTFFPWPNAYRGKVGSGQVGKTTFLIPANSMAFWETRLASFNIDTKKVSRFGETFLQFEDFHGLQLELVEREAGPGNTWEFNGVAKDVAIKGFGGAVLYSGAPHKTADLLENVMELESLGQDGNYLRFKAAGDIGNIIDIELAAVGRGAMGVGTVHHIAWRASNDEEHVKWQHKIHDHQYGVTEVKDRNYFNAIYFRENGGLLFEIATDSPGFMIDEKKDHLGEQLMLPKWQEPNREIIENHLQPIIIREVKGE